MSIIKYERESKYFVLNIVHF